MPLRRLAKIQRKIKRRRQRGVKERLGTAPGTLIAPPEAQAPSITVMAYDRQDLYEATLGVDDLDRIPEFLNRYDVTWINVNGLADTDLIERLGAIFKLHPLALEDVLNVHHRPKTEVFDGSIFVTTRMVHLVTDGADRRMDVEQVSFFLGRNFVLSFQERDGDCLNPVRDRIRKKSGGLEKLRHADYLLYALIDAVVDGYYPVLERFGDMIEGLEDTVIRAPGEHCIEESHEIKRSLQHLRHSLWPMREVITGLISDETLMRREWEPYLRDCSDHIFQILDMLETYRERAASLIDVYISTVSFRMNEVIQVLTIISTIFIPLSFLCGLYGMNFDTSSPYNMPELAYPYGYPILLGVMAIVALFLLYYFYRKGWIAPRNKN